LSIVPEKEASVANVISAAGLDTFTGKPISQICPLMFHDSKQNHCAHFVGHVLRLKDGVGLTCAGMTSKGTKYPGAGACLRVNELFNVCEDLAVPADRGCLIYITNLTNFLKGGLMGQSPHKHVGIYFGGDVWNYSNQAGQVKREKLADFIARMDKAYSGHTVVKYTVIPDSADFLSPAQVQDLAK
jgi:hypothetical protein